jgi:RNA polymerase-binding transcription factor DksA
VSDQADTPDPDPPAAGPSEDEATVLDVAALAVIEGELADVARALERLDEGTYGTCEACGEPIADEVLADAPAASRCAAHAA